MKFTKFQRHCWILLWREVVNAFACSIDDREDGDACGRVVNSSILRVRSQECLLKLLSIFDKCCFAHQSCTHSTITHRNNEEADNDRNWSRWIHEHYWCVNLLAVLYQDLRSHLLMFFSQTIKKFGCRSPSLFYLSTLCFRKHRRLQHVTDSVPHYLMASCVVYSWDENTSRMTASLAGADRRLQWKLNSKQSATLLLLCFVSLWRCWGVLFQP